MSNVHEHKIRNIYADIANLDDDVISYLRRKGINPLNDRLVISDEIIQHILRDSKALANKGIPRDELVYAIHNINNCNIYFDDVKNNIWYVWQGATELYKIVFDVNYSAKINKQKRLINRIATAGKIRISVLNMDTLHKINSP